MDLLAGGVAVVGEPGGKVSFKVVVAVGAVLAGGTCGGVLSVWVEGGVALVLVVAVGVFAGVLSGGVVWKAEAGTDGSGVVCVG